MALLDPRRSIDRLFAGVGQVQRALEFVEFAESLEPVILEATNTLFGFRRRMRTFRRRLVSLGMAVLVVGGSLYVVLAFRNETEQMLPRELPYPVAPLRTAGAAGRSSSWGSSRTCGGWVATTSCR